MHILLATDADWIVNEVTAALGGPDTSFTVCSEGRVVSKMAQQNPPDLAVLDLQIGSMGGMAVTMDLRHDESAGVLDHVPVLMMLDRYADVHLARRSGAEGWIVKPLDALRLQRAAAAVAAGETYTEGFEQTVVDPVQPKDAPNVLDDIEIPHTPDATEPVDAQTADTPTG